MATILSAADIIRLQVALQQRSAYQSNGNDAVIASLQGQFTSGHGPPAFIPAISPAQYVDEDTGGVYLFYANTWDH